MALEALREGRIMKSPRGSHGDEGTREVSCRLYVWIEHFFLAGIYEFNRITLLNSDPQTPEDKQVPIVVQSVQMRSGGGTLIQHAGGHMKRGHQSTAMHTAP